MSQDNTITLENGEMDEIDRELEEFKTFYMMNKTLKNHPKVSVQVNLKVLAFKKTMNTIVIILVVLYVIYKIPTIPILLLFFYTLAFLFVGGTRCSLF